MKKTLFLLLAFVILNQAKAQVNFPMPSENPLWTEEHGNLGGSGYYTTCQNPIYYKSDTLINGTTYNQLFYKGVCSSEYATPPPPQGSPYSYTSETPEALFAIIRQDTLNKTVYIYNYNGSKTEQLLYDFRNIVVGKAYPVTFNNPATAPGFDTLIVLSQDSLILGTKFVKKWLLGTRGNNQQFPFVSIIEGVGSTYGIKALLRFPFENDDKMICFFKDSANLYYPDSTYYCDRTLHVLPVSKPANNSFSISPNPSTGKINIADISNARFINIYNILGTPVFTASGTQLQEEIDLSALPKGMYFVNINDGEKMMISRKLIIQ